MGRTKKTRMIRAYLTTRKKNINGGLNDEDVPRVNTPITSIRGGISYPAQEILKRVREEEGLVPLRKAYTLFVSEADYRMGRGKGLIPSDAGGRFRQDSISTQDYNNN